MRDRIEALTGTQARIALLAVNEGHTLDEALEIAEGYPAEPAEED